MSYIIAITRSQHKEYIGKTESSSDQAVNQQVMWIQQTSGIYQIWRTKFKMKIIKFFWGEIGYSKNKNNKNISQAKSLRGR